MPYNLLTSLSGPAAMDATYPYLNEAAGHPVRNCLRFRCASRTPGAPGGPRRPDEDGDVLSADRRLLRTSSTTTSTLSRTRSSLG